MGFNEPEKNAKVYFATIVILVAADTQGGACDAIGELLRPAETGIVDWGFAATFSSDPTLVNFPDNYEEGDLYLLEPEPEAPVKAAEGKL